MEGVAVAGSALPLRFERGVRKRRRFEDKPQSITREYVEMVVALASETLKTIIDEHNYDQHVEHRSTNMNEAVVHNHSSALPV